MIMVINKYMVMPRYHFIYSMKYNILKQLLRKNKDLCVKSYLDIMFWLHSKSGYIVNLVI